MIEEDAVVTIVEGARVAVEKERRSACSNCQQTCASGVTGRLFGSKTVRLWASSTWELKPGDRVVIGLREDALVQGAFMVYLLPLFGLFVGALLGNAIAAQTAVVSADSFSAVGGLLGMGICLAGVKLSHFSQRLGAQPVILRKID